MSEWFCKRFFRCIIFILSILRQRRILQYERAHTFFVSQGCSETIKLHFGCKIAFLIGSTESSQEQIANGYIKCDEYK